MYRTALRNVLAHKGRLLMTALAVMLGTAFVAGTMVFSDTISRAAKNSYSRSYTDVSVMVTDKAATASTEWKGAKGGEGLTDATLAAVSGLPGTAKARPVISAFAGVADKKGDLIGPSWSARAVNFVPNGSGVDARYPMAEGRGPRGQGEIALDRETARRGGYHVGDRVRIATNGPAVDAVLTGVFTTDDPMVSSGSSLTVLATPEAQRMLLSPGRYSSIEVTAKAGVSEAALKEQVAPLVPGGSRFRVDTARQLRDEQATLVAARTRSLEAVLLTFAGVSLFVGVFIIANTFTMLVAQRTRELGLLRAIGADRSQVTRSVLVEALVIGLSASAAGLLAGVGIGLAMKTGLKSLSKGVPGGPLVVTPTTVGAALAVGAVVTVLSAVVPAVRASRIAPIAALSSGDQPPAVKSLLVRNVVGSVAAAGGVALIAMSAVWEGPSARTAIEAGAVLASVGILVLLPLLSRPVVALVGPLLSRLFGTPGRLARLNAVRNPRRTGATAGALAIGLTLVTTMTVIGTSVTDAVARTVDGGIRADYAVVMANGHGLSPKIAEAVAKAPGVTAASAVTTVDLKVDGTTRTFEGLDADGAGQLVNLSMTAGSADALKQGQALVDSDLAADGHLGAGSTMTVRRPDGSTATLTVGGVFRANQMLSPVLLSNAALAGFEPNPYVSQTLVKGAAGATPALKQAIKDATGSNPVIEIRDRQGMQDEFSHTITSTLSLLYALLAMSVLVAVLGVVNTMAMSVFERKREIGLLRAIGLDRRGIKRMVRLESALISVLGAVVGMVLGSYLAWAAVNTLEVELANITTVIPYGRMSLFLVLTGVVGVLAAAWPARQAARLDILDSIQTA
ncbi:ABC transporter permease [Kitasatospora sp. NPDC056181]|uniref:ABC transporter permease n=1 Tax=Kitasatospora sp. NPDC056181 TaxID=3345737 RepID=UPI0035E1091D